MHIPNGHDRLSLLDIRVPLLSRCLFIIWVGDEKKAGGEWLRLEAEKGDPSTTYNFNQGPW